VSNSKIARCPLCKAKVALLSIVDKDAVLALHFEMSHPDEYAQARKLALIIQHATKELQGIVGTLPYRYLLKEKPE
jgi:hypothetical protein